MRMAFIFPDGCQFEQTVLNRTNMPIVYRRVPMDASELKSELVVPSREESQMVSHVSRNSPAAPSRIQRAFCFCVEMVSFR